jgi:hypothetical protein
LFQLLNNNWHLHLTKWINKQFIHQLISLSSQWTASLMFKV